MISPLVREAPMLNRLVSRYALHSCDSLLDKHALCVIRSASLRSFRWESRSTATSQIYEIFFKFCEPLEPDLKNNYSEEKFWSMTGSFWKHEPFWVTLHPELLFPTRHSHLNSDQPPKTHLPADCCAPKGEVGFVDVFCRSFRSWSRWSLLNFRCCLTSSREAFQSAVAGQPRRFHIQRITPPLWRPREHSDASSRMISRIIRIPRRFMFFAKNWQSCWVEHHRIGEYPRHFCLITRQFSCGGNSVANWKWTDCIGGEKRNSQKYHTNPYSEMTSEDLSILDSWHVS